MGERNVGKGRKRKLFSPLGKTKGRQADQERRLIANQISGHREKTRDQRYTSDQK